MRPAILAVALALQGCGANYVISASSAATTTSTASGGAYATATGGSGYLFLAVMLGVMSTQESSLQPVPQMSPTRSINEQDCTQPVVSGANLRCR